MEQGVDMDTPPVAVTNLIEIPQENGEGRIFKKQTHAVSSLKNTGQYPIPRYKQMKISENPKIERKLLKASKTIEQVS